MISSELQKKVDRAIRLISTSVGDKEVEVSYSGGKDSDVILELAKMAGVKYRAIYKCTTIDPPGTIAHVRARGGEILRPELTFLQLIEKYAMPTRRARFCCGKLKEYKVMDIAIHGIRRDESARRSTRYSENDPVVCRIYGSKKNHVSVILPILGWTSQDVKDFLEWRGVKCHPLYYDENGVFHPERRLGCIACPLQSDQGVSDFKRYPKLLKAEIKALQKWWDSHPNVRSREKFKDVYELVANNLFFKSYEDFKIADNGMFGKTNWKEFLEKQFNIKL